MPMLGVNGLTKLVIFEFLREIQLKEFKFCLFKTHFDYL